MLESEAVLMLDRRDMGALKFELGIPQGCPLSCFLYIICADPFLAALERTEGVEVASGFVDDWSAALRGEGTLQTILELVDEFQAASGQQINTR